MTYAIIMFDIFLIEYTNIFGYEVDILKLGYVDDQIDTQTWEVNTKSMNEYEIMR